MGLSGYPVGPCAGNESSNGTADTTAAHTRRAAGVQRGSVVETHVAGADCTAQRPRLQPRGRCSQPACGERGRTQPRQATSARSSTTSLSPAWNWVGRDAGGPVQYPQGEGAPGREGCGIPPEAGCIGHTADNSGEQRRHFQVQWRALREQQPHRRPSGIWGWGWGSVEADE